jgi:hypothetical protein
MDEIDHNTGASAKADQALAVPVEPVSRLAPSGPSRRLRPTVFEKPKPARSILAAECGLSDDEAMAVLRALVRGGYGIAPRNPTNGMLAGYLEATEPPKHHEATITAIGKARVRWQAMLAHGTEMALSWKFMDRQAIAAGTQSAETVQLAPSEGCQSGGKAASPNPSRQDTSPSSKPCEEQP